MKYIDQLLEHVLENKKYKVENLLEWLKEGGARIEEINDNTEIIRTFIEDIDHSNNSFKVICDNEYQEVYIIYPKCISSTYIYLVVIEWKPEFSRDGITTDAKLFKIIF